VSLINYPMTTPPPAGSVRPRPQTVRIPTRPLGAFPLDGSTRFAAYSTVARGCAVRLYDGEGQATATVPLTDVGNGYHEGEVAGVGHGALYKFVLDGRELPDPYARFLPRGVHGPAMVVQPRHHWLHGPGCVRPLRDHVIYELHVGTFSPSGTYQGVREHLRYLAALGITAIELMPISTFPGGRGWGYDGVAHYAPFSGYGTPDELRALIDEAHGHGLSVFLDVVYNHFGPAGNYLTSYSPDYFSPNLRNAWGDAPNFAHPVMRRFVIDNALYWLGEFRFDGLRLDAVHAVIDPSVWHILREVAREVRQLRPTKLVIAEDERNSARTLGELGMNAVWADDFHHQVRVTLTGERDGYYGAYTPGVAGIAETIRHGWLYRGQIYPPTGRRRGEDAPQLRADELVYCIQNHDQVGNRALGDRLSSAVSTDAYCAASALLLFLPMTPLLFMGQEWAASTPFLFFTDHEPELGAKVSAGRRAEFAGFPAFADGTAEIPDPQDPLTFVRSRLRWDERNQDDHGRVLDLYLKLLQLRRSDPVLTTSGRDGLEAEAHGPVLAVRRCSDAGERLLLVNFSAEPVRAPVTRFASGRPVLVRTGAGGGDLLGAYEAVVYGTAGSAGDGGQPPPAA
jgi:maltooligosyltrehalose trehalohydrolase